MEKIFFRLGRLLLFKPLDFTERQKSELSIDSSRFLKSNLAENTAENKLIYAVQKIEIKLNKILEKLEANEIQEEKLLKWRFAALVMDRLYLILSVIYLVISFVAIVMTIPNFYKPS